MVALQKRRLSFAKSRWVSLGPLLQSEKACISPLFYALLINPFRPLVQSNVVNSVSEPVSVCPVERNISVPAYFDVPF